MRWWCDCWGIDIIYFGLFGRFDFEFCMLEEEFVVLQQGVVGVVLSLIVNVVDIVWVVNGEDEGCGLDIVEFFDVVGKDVDYGVSDVCEDNIFDVVFFEIMSKFFFELDGEFIVWKIVNSYEGVVCQREGFLIGDFCLVVCGYEGGYGVEVRVCFGSNVLVKVKLFFDLLFVFFINELQSQ